jgi:hypothetical protein
MCWCHLNIVYFFMNKLCKTTSVFQMFINLQCWLPLNWNLANPWQLSFEIVLNCCSCSLKHTVNLQVFFTLLKWKGTRFVGHLLNKLCISIKYTFLHWGCQRLRSIRVKDFELGILSQSLNDLCFGLIPHKVAEANSVLWIVNVLLA